MRPNGSSDFVDQAIRGLEKLIAEGLLVPGQRLIEADLATELQIGRGPIREALRILAGDGIVELIPNRGARIRKHDKKELFNRMEVMLDLHLLAIRLFANMPHESSVYKLLSVSARKMAIYGQGENLSGLLFEFFNYHRIININCGNEYIQQIIDRMHIAHYVVEFLKMTDSKSLIETSTAYEKVTLHMKQNETDQAIKLLARLKKRLINSTD